MNRNEFHWPLVLPLMLAAIAATNAWGHGGVVMEEDLCVINIGFLRAHFTLYQPSVSGNEEFCEDLPAAVNTIFVLDYLDDYLREIPLEFRIIRDVKGFGKFTNWDDVQSIEDLAAVTVFYQPPVAMYQGTLTIEHKFEATGAFIGVVRGTRPNREAEFRAVFFFRVGDSNWGYWPLFAGLLLVVQLLYSYNNGHFNRFRGGG